MKFKVSLIILALGIFITAIAAAAYRLQALSEADEVDPAPMTLDAPASEARAPVTEIEPAPQAAQPARTDEARSITPDESDIQRLKGSWGGEFKFETDPEWILLVADFAMESSGLNVQVAFPMSEDVLAVSSPVRLETVNEVTTLQFAIPFQRSGNQNTLTFAGHLQDDKIVGEVIYGQERGIFELAPLADFAPDVYESRT